MSFLFKRRASGVPDGFSPVLSRRRPGKYHGRPRRGILKGSSLTDQVLCVTMEVCNGR